MVRLAFSCLLAFTAATAGALEQEHASEHHDFRLEPVFEGLEHPWGLAFLPDGKLLVTERPGRLNLIDPEAGTRRAFDGLPKIVARGQGGLLDVVLHPNYPETGWVYFSYVATGDEDGLATHVARARLDRSEYALRDRQTLFIATPFTAGNRHFGSRLLFDDDGHLYVTTGDRNERANAQDRETHHGKVLRLQEDGRIPRDNPFIEEESGKPALFTYGHRNPQGLALHPETREIWLHEHGPRGGDELNRIRAGLNYGWPETSFGREYWGPRIGPDPPVEGMEPPIHHWTPAIAPSGMAFYDHDAFPGWRNHLFIGALAGQDLIRVALDGDKVTEEEALLEDKDWRIRAVQPGPDGALYLLVDAADAPIVRLLPTDR